MIGGFSARRPRAADRGLARGRGPAGRGRGRRRCCCGRHRAGDMGWIIERHGGDLRAANMAGTAISRPRRRGSAPTSWTAMTRRAERCWIAERDGERLGCVFLVKDEQPRRRPPAPPDAGAGGAGRWGSASGWWPNASPSRGPPATARSCSGPTPCCTAARGIYAAQGFAARGDLDPRRLRRAGSQRDLAARGSRVFLASGRGRRDGRIGAQARARPPWPGFEVTEYTDAVCSTAWGAEPLLRRLDWRHGHHLAWRKVMGGLVGDAGARQGRLGPGQRGRADARLLEAGLAPDRHALSQPDAPDAALHRSAGRGGEGGRAAGPGRRRRRAAPVPRADLRLRHRAADAGRVRGRHASAWPASTRPAGAPTRPGRRWPPPTAPTGRRPASPTTTSATSSTTAR